MNSLTMDTTRRMSLTIESLSNCSSTPLRKWSRNIWKRREIPCNQKGNTRKPWKRFFAIRALSIYVKIRIDLPPVTVYNAFENLCKKRTSSSNFAFLAQRSAATPHYGTQFSLEFHLFSKGFWKILYILTSRICFSKRKFTSRTLSMTVQ